MASRVSPGVRGTACPIYSPRRGRDDASITKKSKGSTSMNIVVRGFFALLALALMSTWPASLIPDFQPVSVKILPMYPGGTSRIALPQPVSRIAKKATMMRVRNFAIDD